MKSVSAGKTKHVDGCTCTRCVGFAPGNEVGIRFEPGNAAATTHGAYSARLGARVDELAEGLRELVPVYAPADEVAVRLLALALARLEAAAIALETAEPSDLRRLEQDSRGWLNSAARLLDALGMSPTSRARLGVDLTRLADGGLAQLAADGRAALEARGAA